MKSILCLKLFRKSIKTHVAGSKLLTSIRINKVLVYTIKYSSSNKISYHMIYDHLGTP